MDVLIDLEHDSANTSAGKLKLTRRGDYSEIYLALEMPDREVGVKVADLRRVLAFLTLDTEE
jgi:hypothetical protein